MKKTIIFINLRFADFYSQELFKQVKETYQARLIAIVDQQFKDRIGDHVRPYLDEILYVESKPKDGFLGEFALETLRPIIESEINHASDVRLVCTDEFNLLTTGRLRREYNLPGHTDHELIVFRDKIRMKEMLHANRVRVPKFHDLTSIANYAEIVKQTGSPFILKPVDSCGSDGVSVIQQKSDFEHFQQQMRNRSGRFEAEEFIEGALYHVDSWTKDGEIQFIAANEYSFPNHDYTKGKVLASIPLPATNPLAVKLIYFAKQALSVLGANNMVNHMELFVTPANEIIFLEVSARPPGALVNLAHKLNFGINLMDEDFFMQAGFSIDLPRDEKLQKVFWALFPLLPGKVIRLNHPRLQSQCDMTWFIKEGVRIDKKQCENIVAKAAHAIISHADYQQLKMDFDSIKNFKALEVAE